MSRGMFDDTLKLLKKRSTFQYNMEILPDADGYYDKECPNGACLSKFKVNAEDWENIFSDEAVFCPFCGFKADAEKWWTTEQVEQLESQAIEKFEAELVQALKKDAREFNHSQSHNRKSFFKLSMSVKGKTTFVDLPAQALEEMEQKIQCEKCGARYAVVGSAFYCPCCGANSAKQTFSNTIEKVRAKIQNIPMIRKSISESSKDDAERICSSLIESSIPDLVVAFQRLCECIYPTLDNAKPLKKNIFQRIDDGSNLWMVATGNNYNSWLSEEEFSLMRKCFQQRHVLQHKDGIVDQDYIDKSGDTSYSVGQHLIIKEDDINTYSRIIEKIGHCILSLT